MKAWSMFVHSIRLVFNNLDVALRISAVLYGVQVVAQIYNHGIGTDNMVQAPDGMMYPMPSASESLGMMVLGIASLVASLWIAVAWHRYVLLSEEPRGWLPAWPGGAILGYLWRSILIGLILAAVLVPLTLVFSALGLWVVTLAAAVGVGAYVFFRLSPVLPASALGESMGFRAAWAATAPHSGTLVGVALLMIGISMVLQLPTLLSGNPDSFISLIYDIVIGWFATMIGISLLTTVYGHCVEGRGID